MGETPLCELALKHGTDKFAKHHYTATYWERLKDKRETVRSVFEVGIAKGRSLRMWKAFFPNAAIFGFDRNPATMFEDSMIKCFCGDQNDPSSLTEAAKIASVGGKLDLIIDDGNHHWNLQLATAIALLPFLAHDGNYVIEDVMMRVRKDVRVDDPKFIRDRLPRGQYQSEVIRTGEGNDDVLLWVRHAFM